MGDCRARSQSYAWSYDNLYRMTNENISGSGNVGYRFDSVGNRTNRTVSGSLGLAAQTFTYDTNDWLGGDTYDSKGNMLDSGTNSYTYDVQNRLTGSGDWNFDYDTDGNRVVKINTDGFYVYSITYYLVDDRNPTGYPQVLEEYVMPPSGSIAELNRVYNYGLSLICYGFNSDRIFSRTAVIAI